MTRPVLLGFAASLLLLTGCVEGQISTFMIYDDKTDTFKVLQVYSNLAAGEPKDVEHIEMLWKKRESMILQPFQIMIFGADVYERQAKHKYLKHGLGSPAEMPVEAKDIKIDLDSIKIIPGELYINPHGHLSYYHRIEIPGKSVDAFLVEAAPVLAEELAKMAEEEKQLAKDPKAQRQSWATVREDLIDDLLKKEAPKPAPDKDALPELSPFEPATIEMFAKCVKDGSVKLSRNKGTLTVVLPVTKTDAAEIMLTGQAVREAVAKKLKDKEELELRVIAKGLESMKARYIEGAGLEISFDVLMIRAMFQLTGADKVDGDPDATKKAAYADLIVKLQAKNISIAKEPKIKDVLAEYQKK